MHPYSLDLRERVAAAVDHHDGSIRWIARSSASAPPLSSACSSVAAPGTLAPEPHRGGPPRLSNQATWSGWPGWSASSPTRRWSN